MLMQFETKGSLWHGLACKSSHTHIKLSNLKLCVNHVDMNLIII